MSRLPGIMLAGMNLGGDQTARAFALAMTANEFHRRQMLDSLSFEDQEMQRAEHTARMDRNQRHDTWEQEDRTRDLIERQAAQTYYTSAGIDSGMFTTLDPMSGMETSDTAAVEAFGGLPPDVQDARLRAHEQTRRYRDQNRTRLEVEGIRAALAQKALLAKVALIENTIRPRYGNEAADRAIAQAYGVNPSALPKMAAASGTFGGETTRVSIPNGDGKMGGATVPKGAGRRITPEIMQAFRRIAEQDPSIEDVDSWYWSSTGRRTAEVERDVQIQRRAEQLAAEAGWQIPRGAGPADQAGAPGAPAGESAPADDLEIEMVGEAILDQLREKYGGDLPEEAREEFKRLMRERFPDLENDE